MSITGGRGNPMVAVLFTAIMTLEMFQADYEFDDYDLPRIKEREELTRNYIDYHFDSFERYEQFKLNPEQFFMSYYNSHFQALPSPHSLFDYLSYSDKLQEKKNNLNRNKIDSSYKTALETEKLKNDPRYAYKNPDHYWETDPMFYESNIHKMHLKYMDDYVPKWYTLSETEYNFVMVFYSVFKKDYESTQDFIDARFKTALLIQENTPNMTETFKLTSNGEISEVLMTRTLLRSESYTEYLMRMMYLDAVPMHQNVCKMIYGRASENMGFSVPPVTK